MRSLRRLLRRALFGAAAAAVAIAATLGLYLTPPLIHALLGLSGAPALLGVEPRVAEELSDALVGDLLTGGSFDVPYGGAPLLSAGERAHLVDVGGLLRGTIGAGLVGLILLAVFGLRRRGWGRTAVRDGATLLALGAVTAAAAFALAFDATFAFFHGLFFASGTWTFNPATDRLVQLYPERFWILVALLFCLTLATIALIAYRLARRSR